MAPLSLLVGTLIATGVHQQGFAVHEHPGGNGFGANTGAEPVIRRDCLYRIIHYPSLSSRSRKEWLKKGAQVPKADLNLLVVDFGRTTSPF